MSLKSNGITAIISLSLGIGLGYKIFANKQPVVITKTEIKEIEKKTGVIERKIIKNKDGSEQIEEKESYVSDRKTESESSQKSGDKKTTWSVVPKYSFRDNAASVAAAYSYNGLGVYLSSDMQVGLVLSLSY